MEKETEGAVSPIEGVKKCQWGEMAAFTYTHLHEQVKLADQKAAVVFFAAVGLLGYIVNSRSFPRGWSVALRGAAELSAAVAGMALSAAAITALAVVIPRLSSESRVVPVFFKNICSLQSATEYIQAIECLSPDEAQRGILQENFAVANICNTKYRVLVASIWIGAVGYLAAFVHILLRR